MDSPEVYTSGSPAFASNKTKRAQSQQPIANISINTKARKTNSERYSKSSSNYKSASSRNQPIRQSFNINVVSINKRYSGGDLGKAKSFKADGKNKNSTHTNRTKKKVPNGNLEQSDSRTIQSRKENDSKVSSSVRSLSTTKRSNFPVSDDFDTALPAIVKYKNRKIFSGLSAGQAQIVKEIAKTTDVRRDLYQLQKRKVEILASLERKMRISKEGQRKIDKESKRTLEKCPAYYNTLTQSTADFLPVDDGQRHLTHRECYMSQTNYPGPQNVGTCGDGLSTSKLKALTTDVSIHRCASRHKATLKNDPEVFQHDRGSSGQLNRDKRSDGSKMTGPNSNLPTPSMSEDNQSELSILSQKVPVENRNVLMNVNLPLRTNNSRGNSKENSNRWPLIENGFNLEGNVRLEGIRDKMEKEWCTLESPERAGHQTNRAGYPERQYIIDCKSGVTPENTTRNAEKTSKKASNPNDNDNRGRRYLRISSVPTQKGTYSGYHQTSSSYRKPLEPSNQLQLKQKTVRSNSVRRTDERSSRIFNGSRKVSSSNRSPISYRSNSNVTLKASNKKEAHKSNYGKQELNSIGRPLRTLSEDRRMTRQNKSLKDFAASLICSAETNSSMLTSEDLTLDFSLDNSRQVNENYLKEQDLLISEPGRMMTCESGGQSSSAAIIDRKTGKPLISLRSLVSMLKRHEHEKTVGVMDDIDEEKIDLRDQSVQTFREEAEDQSSHGSRRQQAIKVRTANDVFNGMQTSPASYYTDANSFPSGDYMLQSIDIQNSTNLNFSANSNNESQYVYRLCKSQSSNSNEVSEYASSDKNCKDIPQVETSQNMHRCETRIIHQGRSNHQSLESKDRSGFVLYKLDPHAGDIQRVDQVQAMVPRGKTLVTDCSFNFDLIDSRNEETADCLDPNMCEIRADHWWLNRKRSFISIPPKSKCESRQDKEQGSEYLQEVPKLPLGNILGVERTEDLDNSEREMINRFGKRRTSSYLDQTGDTVHQCSNRIEGPKEKGFADVDIKRSFLLGFEENVPGFQVFCVQNGVVVEPGDNQQQVYENEDQERRLDCESEPEIATRSFMYTDRSSKNYVNPHQKAEIIEALRLGIEQSVGKPNFEASKLVEAKISNPPNDHHLLSSSPWQPKTTRRPEGQIEVTDGTTDFLTCTTATTGDLVIPVEVARKESAERELPSSSYKTAPTPFYSDRERHSMPNEQRRRSSSVKLEPVMNTARPFVAVWKAGSKPITEKIRIEPISCSSQESAKGKKVKQVDKKGGSNLLKQCDMAKEMRDQLVLNLRRKKSPSKERNSGDESTALKSNRLIPSSARNLKRKTSSPIRLERVTISPVKRRSSLTTATTLTNPVETQTSPRTATVKRNPANPVAGDTKLDLARIRGQGEMQARSQVKGGDAHEMYEETVEMALDAAVSGYMAEQSATYSSSAMTEPPSYSEIGRPNFEIIRMVHRGLKELEDEKIAEDEDGENENNQASEQGENGNLPCEQDDNKNEVIEDRSDDKREDKTAEPSSDKGLNDGNEEASKSNEDKDSSENREEVEKTERDEEEPGDREEKESEEEKGKEEKEKIEENAEEENGSRSKSCPLVATPKTEDGGEIGEGEKEQTTSRTKSKAKKKKTSCNCFASKPIDTSIDEEGDKPKSNTLLCC